MFSMYGALIMSFIFTRVSVGFDTEQCKDYGHYLIQCCKGEYPASKLPIPDDMSECNSKDFSPCERNMCQAKKMGLTGDDGKIDKSKVVDSFYKKIADDPDLMEDVKSKCINGDIEVYASSEACDSEKITRCVSMQWLKRCTKWDDITICQQFKGFIKECMNFFP